jgi:hypothetical protein
MVFTNLKKTDMVLIYGEARGHSELARKFCGERFTQSILPNARTFINVVQHLRDFGRFEMNKRDLGLQREDRILVPEKEFLTKLKTNHEQVLGVLQITWEFLSLRGQNTAQEIRQNRGILNRVRLSWARHACIANDGKHFEQLL